MDNFIKNAVKDTVKSLAKETTLALFFLALFVIISIIFFGGRG
jgi:hypothetical protein